MLTEGGLYVAPPLVRLVGKRRVRTTFRALGGAATQTKAWSCPGPDDRF